MIVQTESANHTTSSSLNTFELIESTEEETSSDENNDTSAEREENDAQISVFVTLAVGFVLLWQSVFKIANVATELLLKFLQIFLMKAPFITDGKKVAKFFPTTLLKGHKLLSLNRDDFEKLVSCPKCSTLYKFDDCIESALLPHKVKSCSHVSFPRHPWPHKPKPCGTPLLKKIKTSKGKEKFIPIQSS